MQVLVRYLNWTMMKRFLGDDIEDHLAGVKTNGNI
jgi:hypothetical protein